MEAGEDLSALEYGYNALLPLRIPKSFSVWSAEFRQEYTPGVTGMDRWIAWSKDGFVGSEATRKENDAAGAPQKLVTLEVNLGDADTPGYEPVWNCDEHVGYVASGDYGHTVGKSLAMALIDREPAAEGTELSVHRRRRTSCRRDRAFPLRPRRQGDADVSGVSDSALTVAARCGDRAARDIIVIA